MNQIYCKGTASYNFRTGEYKLIRSHTHSSDTANVREENESFLTVLKQVAATQHDKLEILYERQAVFHPNAAQRLPYRQIKSTMEKARRNNVPPVLEDVNSLSSFVRLLNTEDFSHLKVNQNVNLNFTFCEESNSVIIIDSAEFVRTVVFRESGVFFINESTRVVPPNVGCSKLLTVMAMWSEMFVLPVAHVLMSSVSVEAYKVVFRNLKNLMPGFEITEVITPINDAMREGIISTFRDANVEPSLHHIAKKLFYLFSRNGVQNKLTEATRDDHEEEIRLQELLRGMIALPTLTIPKILEIKAHWREEVWVEHGEVVTQLLGGIENLINQISLHHFSMYKKPH
ncbi:uncharacterized protein LOC127278534 isoform X2 [Leptopilina boulardi]|nr:uncharacterized protein LOC127278534 isoform X2 [Leptopilina boulardi]XP_051156246.1 uncharacterized protein LOC127278534 isoform X2 [Leptopilina boulardi]